MRQTISGMVAAVAVMMTAGAAPAMACGGGLFQSSCSPCAYSAPCAPAYVAPIATGCGTGCGGYGYGYGGYTGYAHQQLADPEQQYYYVNQGPTYTGPDSFAPEPVYREGSVSGYRGYRHRSLRYGYRSDRYVGEAPVYRPHRHFRPYRGYSDYRYSARPSVRYGYAPRHSFAPRYRLPPRVYGGHHSMRYGAPMMPRHYGRHDRVLRRYY
jgi:hypothetical protein